MIERRDPTAESPEAFVAWIKTATPEELQRGLMSLDDRRRRQVKKAVLEAHRKAHQFVSSTRGRFDVAVAAVGSWTHAKKLPTSPYSRPPGQLEDVLVEVLCDRRPDWLDRWLEHHLSTANWERPVNWSVVRALIRRGACQRPTLDVYVLPMIESSLDAGSAEGVARALRNDPELLDYELWRAFEIGPGDSGHLARAPLWKWSTWGVALVQLAADGTVDRQRLLESALQALIRGIQPPDFHLQLVGELSPTLDECDQLSGALSDLMLHAKDAVVKLGLKHLARLAAARRLDAQLLPRLAPVWQRETKGPAGALLALLDQAVRAETDLTPEASDLAAGGLSHPRPDVQERVLDFLEGAVPDPEPRLARSVGEQLPYVSPSQAERAKTLAERLSPASGSELDPGSKAGLDSCEGDPQGELDDVLRRAASLSGSWRTIAGIDELVTACETGAPAPTWRPDSIDLPRLDPERRIEPVTTFDELVDLLLAQLENCDGVDQFERALDGLCRLGGSPPADLAERTASLLHSAETPNPSVAAWSGTRDDLARVIRVWLGSMPEFKVKASGNNASPDDFRAARCHQVVQRLSEGRGLLALPTHSGGWIDPRVFVHRILSQAQREMRHGGPDAPADPDLVQALLRLAPDHRQDALVLAADLPGDVGAAVRFALGGDEHPTAESNESLWIAAGRCRLPHGTLAELDGLSAAEEAYGVQTPKHWLEAWLEQQLHRPGEAMSKVRCEPPLGLRRVDRPITLLSFESQPAYAHSDVTYYQGIWPLDPEPTYIAGVSAMNDRLARPAAETAPAAIYLEPLFAPENRFTPIAQQLVAVALIVKDADARTAALDLVVELAGSNRCLGNELGLVYVALNRRPGYLKLGRIADATESLMLHGPVLHHVCRRLLEELLADLGTPGRDAHHLLTAYREALAATSRPADSRTVPLLRSFKGSGKAAKLARAILDLDGDDEAAAASLQSATSEVLRNRLDQVETWIARNAADR